MNSTLLPRTVGHLSRIALVAATAGLLSACQDTGTTSNSRAYQPISNEMLDLMASKGTNERAPVLIRAYKKEAELEIWKMKDDGQYTLLKTYPMCRWSGQLGPKTREGDRQVPEGFYTITPGQMNPNSAYYLSFNVGYPNAYDKAHNYTGSEIMVHGVCSSAGCFSMTDEQIAEIYAIAREAFGGGERAIQMQSLPFHMTAENLAKYRLDPNMNFWKELKKGVDDFDVTRHEPKVDVCGKHYVFDENPTDPHAHLDAAAPCPPMTEDQTVAQEVEQKETQDNATVAKLITGGMKPIRTVYDDGGQNPVFASRGDLADVSRPDALARGPVDIALGPDGKPLPDPKPASAPAKPVMTAKTAPAAPKPAGAGSTTMAVTAYAPAELTPAASADNRPFYKKWLGFGSPSAPAPAPAVAATPAVAPSPAAAAAPQHKAANAPDPKTPAHKPAPANEPTALRATSGSTTVAAAH